MVTRSMDQTTHKADTQNAVGDKVTERASKETTVENAEVTDAKSGATQEVFVKNFLMPSKNGKSKKKRMDAATASLKVARPSSTDKYFDLDPRTLALGIFMDTLKEEHLKNDPDFTFTPEFYHAAVQKFKSLNADNRALYIARAKKRNSIEDPDVAASKEVKLQLNVFNYSNVNLKIEDEALRLYSSAVKAERRKDDPGFTFAGIVDPPDDGRPFRYADYDPVFAAFMRLDDNDKAPYTAEAMVRYLDKRVATLTKVAKGLYDE